MKNKRRYLKDLIPVNINKLVLYDGSFEFHFDGKTLSLVPENHGKRCFLAVFVNNIRQPMQWELSARPHVGRLQNGAVIGYRYDQVYYIIGGDGRRYRHLFLDVENHRLGVRTDFFANNMQAYPHKREANKSFKEQCRAMERELFGEDEWEAFHRKTVLKSRLGI